MSSSWKPPGTDQNIALRLKIHSKGNERRIKKWLLGIQGVRRVEFDLNNGVVIVSGTIDPSTLLMMLENYGVKAEIFGPQRRPVSPVKDREIVGPQSKVINPLNDPDIAALLERLPRVSGGLQSVEGILGWQEGFAHLYSSPSSDESKRLMNLASHVAVFPNFSGVKSEENEVTFSELSEHRPQHPSPRPRIQSPFQSSRPRAEARASTVLNLVLSDSSLFCFSSLAAANFSCLRIFRERAPSEMATYPILQIVALQMRLFAVYRSSKSELSVWEVSRGTNWFSTRNSSRSGFDFCLDQRSLLSSTKPIQFCFFRLPESDLLATVN
nr:heavy metal-associated isoprenylated plant protein 6-like [Ipomoea batatas]